MHNNCFIHRDLKPDNFLIGDGHNTNIIYLIDFGLAKMFKNSKSGEHIPFKDNKSLTGTIRYASINTHLGIEQSRRDDLETIAYMLIQFAKGKLPWQGLNIKDNDPNKLDRIIEVKLCTSVEALCDGLPGLLD